MNNSFLLKFSNYQKEIEVALEGYTAYDANSMQAKVCQAMQYSLLGGGKRLRAVLALEFCRAFGGDISQAMPAACAIEMVHAYSLIHDDLPCMDDDDLRRGKPTSHKKFGENIAVLAGDGLLTKAFETLSAPETIAEIGAIKAINQVRILSFASGDKGMLGGQVIDVLNEGNSLTKPQHEQMCAMKTGALIKAAVLLGCSAGLATAEQTKAAEQIGEDIGLAFQITDDILDVIGDTDVLGKNIGSDEKFNKVTFVTILGLEQAQKEADRLLLKAKLELKNLFADSEFLESLVDFLIKRTN